VTKKQTEDLIKMYERHYKYYKGWVFSYEHPGIFMYHQMGGQMSVAFTPEYDVEDNTISLQVDDGDGRVIFSDTVPFEPVRHDVIGTKVDPWFLFTQVRPLLEKYGTW